MKIKYGIMMKLFLWYCALIIIFYGTIFVLFIHMRHIMKISENIVNVNYKISSASKKMIDSLLWMAENESKYDLLKKEDYKEYFMAAQKEYEGNLREIMEVSAGDSGETNPWNELYCEYKAQLPASLGDVNDEEPAKTLWIPEEIINNWVDRIFRLRAENEQAIELEMRSVNIRGQMALRWGLIGLGSSILVGVFGSIFFALSMIRPLRELRRGIHSVSGGGLKEPIRVFGKDEFGELAGAFNDMGARLKHEERMRSDFISMLSHEIRTPLTSIRESVNLISEEVMGPVNERQRRFLEIASREIERITDLLNHLMHVSRLEAGALDINPRPMDPSEFVSGSIYRVTPAAEAKGIAIRADIPNRVPRVLGDPDNLQQVLLNLLGNAIKFSPPDTGITVKVDAGDGGDGSEVTISVTDCGPGIQRTPL